jgi:hypothetical protein
VPTEAARTTALLPDFVGLGALKAGTSYLDAMLRSHPQLSLPAQIKEVQFFTRHHHRGAAWYAGHFGAPDGRLRGEVSPQYLHDASCAPRIFAANPGAKLLVSVRHPVDRAHSQYRHWVQETGYGGSFAEFLVDHPGAIERSHYWAALQPFLEQFPAGQLHVIVFEDMVDDPRTVLREVYGFLGVDPDHLPEDVDQAVNVSGAPRYPRLYARSKKVSRLLHDHGAGRLVGRLKNWGPGAIVTRQDGPPTSGIHEQASAHELDTALAGRFRDDADRLSAFLGRDLTALWKLADR